MGFAIVLLTVLQLLAALLLIGIVLIQQSKAGGGLGAVGGGTTETVFGATAGNVLTKGTVILASIFLGAALLVQVLQTHAGTDRSLTEGLQSEAAAPALPEGDINVVSQTAEVEVAAEPAAEAAAPAEAPAPAAETPAPAPAAE